MLRFAVISGKYLITFANTSRVIPPSQCDLVKYILLYKVFDGFVLR
jgi:hypothetical protein